MKIDKGSATLPAGQKAGDPNEGSIASILYRVLLGERLNAKEALLLYSANLHVLAKAATAVRQRLNPGNTVSFIVDRNISYTNICSSGCDFCAFFVPAGSPKGYTLSHEEILGKVRELAAIGGTQVLLQGGLNPKLRLDYYCDLLKKISSEFPQITIHSFSPTEIDFFAKLEGKTIREILLLLKEAGLHSLPGGGGEILAERVRDLVSPQKISAFRWLEIQREAHELGMKTTATMVFGHIETLKERIAHLLQIRELQDETGGFRAFIPWTMSTPGTKISYLKKVGGDDYLRTVALSRLVLDNVPHIQSGWVTEGPKLAQLALAFGADDMGGVVMEEKVLSPTGLQHQMNSDDMCRAIREAGYQPLQRNTRYEIVQEFS